MINKEKGFYDYENKKQSRIEIKKYIEAKHKMFHFKPYSELKVLLLSHIEGRDLKEIYFPLGFNPKNITVIERELDIINQMKKNPTFKDVTLVHSDLKEFVPQFNFDVFHLDFKANINISLFENIVTNLIVYSQYFYQRDGNPIIFYFNFLGARETINTSKSFKTHKKIVNKAKKDTKDLIETLKNSSEIGIQDKFFLQDLYHDLGSFSHILTQPNKHYSRAGYILEFVKRCLHSPLPNRLSKVRNVKYKRNKKTIIRILRKESYYFITSTYLHYVSNLPNIYEFYPFKYMSKKRHPFLSCLFVLDNISRIILFDNFIKIYHHNSMNKFYNTQLSLDQNNIKNSNLFNEDSYIKKVFRSLKHLEKNIFSSKKDFIMSSLVTFFSLNLLGQKRIKQDLLFQNLKKTLDNLSLNILSKESLSVMTHDYIILAKWIYKILKNNSSITINESLIEFNLINKKYSINFKFNKDKIRKYISRFLIGLETLGNLDLVLQRRHKYDQIKDISVRLPIKKKDFELSLVHPTTEMRKAKTELSQNELESRKSLVISYLDKYACAHNSMQIAFLLNKEHFIKNDIYPIPLFSDFEIRGYLGQLKINGVYYIILKNKNIHEIENNEYIKKKALNLLGNFCYFCGIQIKANVSLPSIMYNKNINSKKIKIDIKKDIHIVCKDCCIDLYRERTKNPHLQVADIKHLIWNK